MCGRFTLILDPVAIQQEFDLGDIPPEMPARFNVAPTQPVAVVTDGENRAVELFRWGLIPSWAKDASIGSRMINARSETLAEKPSFRTALAARRCLILADGFYEWRHPTEKGAHPQPYYFRLASGKPFTFAGLWDTWRSPQGETVRSCTVITCAANERVAPFHDRMPVIFDRDHLWAWLNKQAKPAEVQALLQPYPAQLMTAQPVSNRINSPSYDAEDCILPVVEPGIG